MLTAAAVELLALGLAGIATVVAVGSVIAALGTRRAPQPPADRAEEDAPR